MTLARAAFLVVLLLWAPAWAAPTFLTAQVLVAEEQVTVVLRMDVAGDAQDAAGLFPLLTPEQGPGPVIAPRSEEVPDGLSVQTSGPVRVLFAPDGLRFARSEGEGDVRVEVRYALPVRGPQMPLVLAPERTLHRVRVVTRRTASYSPQVRPLAPYDYAEEDDEDGTWQVMTLREPVRAGGRLRIALSHLPAPLGAYRVAALVGLIAVVTGVGLASLRGGRGR